MSSRAYRFQSFAVAFDVVVEGGSRPLLSDTALRAALPPTTRARRSSSCSRSYVFRRHQGRRVLIIDDGAPLECPTSRAAQDLLEGDVALHVAATAPHHVFIHAGVVGWRGRALLLPGRTFTGKSTLVQALVARGATYYSDEYAVIDSKGRVHPYPRRMSIRQKAGLPRRILPARLGRRGLRAGWVLGSRFEPSREALAIDGLSRGRTALLLLDNAVAARLESERVLRAVRLLSECSEGAMIVRGDARAAANELLLLLTSQGILNTKVRG